MKQPNWTKRIALFLLILALLALTGAAGTGVRTVAAAREALARIGAVSYTEESRQVIEEATQAVNALDAGLGLSDIFDLEALKSAQAEYIRLAIRDLYIAREEGSEEEITEKIRIARELVDAWLTPEDAGRVSNYGDLTDAERDYQSAAPAVKETEAIEEELELCGI